MRVHYFYATLFILVVALIALVGDLRSSARRPAGAAGRPAQAPGPAASNAGAVGIVPERLVTLEPEVPAPFEAVPEVERAAADETAKALGKPVSFAFAGEPLARVMDFLRKALGVNLVVAFRTPWDEEPQVDLTVTEMPARDAMELVLFQTETAWTYRESALYVSTPEDVRRLTPHAVKGYELNGLIAAGGGTAEDVLLIARGVLKALNPTPEDEETKAGEKGRESPAPREELSLVGTKLLADLTPNDHVRLANLLRLLAAAGQAPRARVIAPQRGRPSEADKRLQEKLDAPIEPFRFEAAPLREALDYVRTAASLPAVLVVGIDEDQAPVTLALKGMTVRAALDWIASEPNGWLLHRGAVVVTSEERARELAPVETRLYDMRDILGPSPDPSRKEACASRCRAIQGLLGTPDKANEQAGRCLWNDYLVLTASADEHRAVQERIEAARTAGPAAPVGAAKPKSERD